MRRYSYMPVLLAAAALFAGACQESPRGSAPLKPIPAEVFTASYEEVPASIAVPGSVQARYRTVISSQINGFVKDARVKAGASVSEGQVLMTLDARDAESQKAAAAAGLAEARAALDEARKAAAAAANMRDAAKASANLAENTHARYLKLFETKSVSPQELDEVKARRDAAAADLAARETMAAAAQDRLRQVEARIDQAGAQAQRADVLLGWTVIKAPAAGRIAERSVDPGSAVFPGSPLLVLESTVVPQVLADMPAGQADLLRTGLQVTVLEPGTSAALQGAVSEIIPVSVPGTHTVRFKVDMPAGFSAPSGRFVEVRVPSGSRRIMLVPRRSLRQTGQLTGVFVVDASASARFRLVKTAPYDADRIELLSGLDAGEKIIRSPGSQILDGTPVEVRQ